MIRPKFAIITPSYNQAPFVQDCLTSVAQQGNPSIEHLVIDGASTDGSAEHIEKFAKGAQNTHLRWTSEPDRGQSHAINKGFLLAKGEYIGWLNADDRYRSRCLEAVERAFREHPEVDILYGDYTWVNEQGSAIQVRREIGFSRFVLLYHRVLYIPTTATFFRRRVLEAGNLLDESLHYAMDFEYFLRLTTLGYRFMHLPQLLADYRVHSASKSSRCSMLQREEHEAILHRYAPVLSPRLHSRFGGALLPFLRSAAAIRRYSEKALRGYYFTQFRQPSLCEF